MSAILNEQPKRKRLSARKRNPTKRQKVADDGICTGTPIVNGIQFVDMTIFSSVFSILPCKECNECCQLPFFERNGLKRKGCASPSSATLLFLWLE
jgi:hypothetical protein